MTEVQEHHLRTVKERFAELVDKKYRAGQVEHGGNLWQKNGLIDFTIEEAIDQVVYLLTLKEQLEKAGIELGTVDEV